MRLVHIYDSKDNGYCLLLVHIFYTDKTDTFIFEKKFSCEMSGEKPKLSAYERNG